MKAQFSRQFPRSLSLLVLPALLAGMLLIGLLWLTSQTAGAQAGITIEMPHPELHMDRNQWCSSGSPFGPDGSWYPIRVTNNSITTYTGLELQITPAFGLTIDDATRYLGDLEPGDSANLFIFVDYHQLRDLLPCGSSDPPVAYDELVTVTVRSLSGGMAGTATFTETLRAEGMTSAASGGAYRDHTFGPGFYVGQVFTMEVEYGFGNNPSNSPVFFQPTGNWDFRDGCFRLVGTEVIYSTVAGVTVGVNNTLWFSDTDTAQGDIVRMLYAIEILCSEGATELWPWAELTTNDEKYNDQGYGGDAIITITQPISGAIGVSKSVTPTVLPSGGVVTYTVRFQNMVTVPILVSTIDDALPPGVVYGGVTASSDVNLGNSTVYPTAGATGALVWRGVPQVSYRVPPSGTVSAGVPGYIDLIYTATVTSTQGIYTNWLTGTVGKEPTDPIGATVWVGKMADLSLSKSSRPVPAVPGAAITYTLAVRNAGPSTVTAITLTDNLPAVVLTPTHSASAGSYVSATGAWTGLTLGAGDRVTLTIVGTLDTAFSGALQNTAVVTTSQAIDPDLSDNESTDINLSAPMIEATKRDVLFTDADGDGMPSPGDTLSYTVVISNVGGCSATGVIFSDIPDVNTALVVGTVQTSQGIVTSGNGPGDTSVAVDIAPPIPGGGSVTVGFRVTINDPLPPGVTKVTNQGVVMGDDFPAESTDDPDTPEEDDDTETFVMTTPDVEAYKSATLWIDANDDGVVSPGDTLLYQVIVVNNGNGAAEGVLFSDLLADPNLALVIGTVQTDQGTVTSGNNPGDTGVVVDIGAIPGGGGAVDISYQATITSPLPPGVTQVANQGWVTGDNFPSEPSDDPETPDEDDSTETSVVTTPDVEVYKSDMLLVDADGDGVVSPGDTLLYQVSIVNDGNGAAEGLLFSDLLADPNLTLVTGTVQSNLGTVTSGNNPGDTGIVVEIGAIAGGGSMANISYQAVIASPLPPGVTQVANQGWVTGDNIPSEPSDDPETPGEDDGTETFVMATPDVEAYKSDALLIDADGNGVVSPGDTLLYQVIVVNNGNGAAEGVSFSDLLNDPNLTLVIGTVQTSLGTVTSGNAPGDIDVVVDIGTIPGGGSAVDISYRAVIADPVPPGVTQVTNQGLVTGDNFPVEPSDDPNTPEEDDDTEASVTVTPDVEAYKSDALWMDADGNGMVSPGDTLLYQVIVVNNGNGAAEGVLFSDLLADPNLTLVIGTVQTDQGTVTSGNAPGDTDVVVDVGTIPGGGGAVDISYQATITSPLPPGVAQVANQGLVTGDNFPSEPSDDPETPDEDDDCETTVVVAPDVEVYKTDFLLVDTDRDAVASPGDILLYGITIINDGNGAAEGVVFTDVLTDPNLTLVTGTVQTSLGTVISGNNVGDTGVTVDIGAIPGGGGAVDISYQAAITDPFPLGVAQVANQGWVSGDNIPVEPSDDPHTPDEDDETETFIYSLTDLTISKDAEVDYITSITFTIIVRNLGPAAADGAVMSDTIPSPVTNVTWNCSAAGGASCGAGGTSNVITDTLMSFPAGGVVTYTVNGILSIWHYWENCAAVIAPAGVTDTNINNNRAFVYRHVLLLPIIFRNATPPIP